MMEEEMEPYPSNYPLGSFMFDREFSGWMGEKAITAIENSLSYLPREERSPS